MAFITQINTDAAARFFDPLKQVDARSKSQYTCRSMSDLDYAVLGALRCVSHTKTGHEFLQHHVDHRQPEVEVSHFFKALQSGRRLANLISINREGESMKRVNNFVNQVIRRATQRTQRFIRWLRVALSREAPWADSVGRLAAIWTKNL